ncbi:MAG: hypothetical protein Q9219_003311 [cf. Caloplaca sp. 3 TL-2023]
MKATIALLTLSFAAGITGAPTVTPRDPVRQAPPAPPALSLRDLAARQLGNTQNDVANNSPCKALTVIFARGTTETGNVGTITGPPFFRALYKNIGSDKVALQGVDYPADIQGFLAGGDDGGSRTMANLVSQTASRCPATKIVLSGYSQGGQLVHKAAKLLSPALSGKVDSVVIFGDPDNGQPVGSIPSSKVLIICHVGDDICLGGDLILPPHLDYALNAKQAALFVKKQSGL